MRNSFDAAICHSKHWLHLADDCSRRYFHVSMLQDSLLNLSDVPYALIMIDNVLHNTSDTGLLEDRADICLALVDEANLFAFQIFVEISYHLQLHIEEICDFLACSILWCKHLNNLYSFVYIQLSKCSSLPVRTCRVGRLEGLIFRHWMICATVVLR